MVQRVRVLAAMPEDDSSIHMTHTTERTYSYKLSSGFHTCVLMDTHKHTF